MNEKIQKPAFSGSNSVAGASVSPATSQNVGNVNASVGGTANGTAISHNSSEINSTWNSTVNSGKRKEGADGNSWV